jgi:hypothetical protein
MAQFAPNIVFTDPTMASQLVRLSDLDAAHKNEQQQMAMAAMARQQALAAHQQDQQNRMAYQYAALANQQRAQDLADKRAAAELASRENMFGQQMGLSREGLSLQRELGLANPYGRAAGDILLGGMQTNNQVDQANAASEAEAASLTAALNELKNYHRTQSAAILAGDIPHSLWWAGGDEKRRAQQALDMDVIAKRQAIFGQAKNSKFNPSTGGFDAIKRSAVAIPGAGRLNSSQQPAPSPSQEPVPSPAPDNTVPQAGNFYQQLWGGAPQNQLQFGGPSLNPYPMTPPAAGAIGGGLDGLKQRYLNGDITAEDYLQQFDGLNQ